MTIEEKKKYLQRYQAAVRQLAFCEAELHRVETLETRITQVLSNMPTGSPDGSKPELATERKDNAQQMYKAAVATHHRTMVEISNLLNNQLDGKELMVMQLRYLTGLKWEDVADRVGITMRWMWKLHTDALQRIVIENKIE